MRTYTHHHTHNIIILICLFNNYTYFVYLIEYEFDISFRGWIFILKYESGDV
jgi:hypothetical protein